MNYLIDPKIFYWMSVLGSLEMFLIFVGIVSFCVYGFIMLLYTMDKNTISEYENHPKLIEKEKVRCSVIEKKFKLKPAILSLILLFGIPVFIPSQDTMVKMIVASQVTSENYEFAKDEITELIDYIVDKIENKSTEE